LSIFRIIRHYAHSASAKSSNTPCFQRAYRRFSFAETHSCISFFTSGNVTPISRQKFCESFETCPLPNCSQ